MLSRFLRLLTLAARNLQRNGRRTAITASAIAFGLGMMIVTINIANGQYQATIREGTASLSGHVVVQAEGWQDAREDTQFVPESGSVAARIAELAPTAVVARRMHLGGVLMSATTSATVLLEGVEPRAERAVSNFDERLVEGTWLGDGEEELVLGAGLRTLLGVEIGDSVVYLGQHGSPEMTSQRFRVCGVFRTGGPEIDQLVAFAPLSSTQLLLGRGDAAHQVTVHLEDARDSMFVADTVKRSLAADGLDVRWWREALPQMWALIQLDKKWTNLTMAILGAIVGMGVLNTVLMSVLERVRELGVLLAIGMRPRQLALMVLLEGALLGAVGCVAGLLLGIGFTWPFAKWGFDYTPFVGETMEYAGLTISALIQAEYDWVRMARYVVATFAFTVTCAAYPAWYVTRLTPVDAMGHA